MINEKAIKAANFLWSIYPLIMLDSLLLRLSLHFTPLHYTFWHFSSSHLNFLPLHITWHHYTSPHFTSLHWFSPHFYSFHFTPFIIAFLTLFLKILGLQGKVPNVSAGSWFQFLMVLFTKEYFPISLLWNTVPIKGSSVNQHSLLSDMSCQNAAIHLSTFILQQLLYLIKNLWGKNVFSLFW